MSGALAWKIGQCSWTLSNSLWSNAQKFCTTQLDFTIMKEGMEVCDVRRHSFYASKRVKVSPVSARANGHHINNTKLFVLIWPHPQYFSANPATLAEAGFYYDPLWPRSDRVTCFMCGLSWSSFTSEEDPHQVHAKRCRWVDERGISSHCSWAVARCISNGDLDEHGL
jgi:hypothetical protein